MYFFTNSFFIFTNVGYWAGAFACLAFWALISHLASDCRRSFVTLLWSDSAVTLYTTLLGTVCLSLFPIIAYSSFRMMAFPSDADVTKERLSRGVHDLVVSSMSPLARPSTDDTEDHVRYRRRKSIPSVCVQNELAKQFVERASSTAGGYAFSESSRVDRIGLYLMPQAGDGKRRRFCF
jgi:hypothetical protein